ncbi:MAG: MOSC domain-containing protein [Casimicrobiaceae bacterium]
MSVERIFLAAKPGEEQVEVDRVNVTAEAGIAGDRYFGAKDEPGQNITLVEAEAIEAFFAEVGRPGDLSCTRRNIVTRGVRLNALVGKEFTIGSVRARGVELCEPCRGLGSLLASAGLSTPEVVKRFVHRAGLRADILSSGNIAVGSKVAVVEEPIHASRRSVA